jgi:hypothetical protein
MMTRLERMSDRRSEQPERAGRIARRARDRAAPRSASPTGVRAAIARLARLAAAARGGFDVSPRGRRTAGRPRSGDRRPDLRSTLRAVRRIGRRSIWYSPDPTSLQVTQARGQCRSTMLRSR